MTGARPFPPAVEHPRWDAWFSRAHEEDFKPYGNPLVLHHYARFEATMSVLSSDTLWATDARGLRDSTELSHGLPMCLAALGRLAADPRTASFVFAMFQGLEERFRYETFVSCFSLRNDIQSQWESYADKQRGFAIGFSNICLSGLSAPSALRIMPVEYDQGAKERRAIRAAARAEEDIWDPRSATEYGIAYTIHSRLTLLGIEFFYLCSTYKAPRFQTEEEWRLVYAGLRGDPDRLPVMIRRSDGRPYVEIDLNRTFRRVPTQIYNVIREGPQTPPGARDLVQSLLGARGLGVAWERQTPFGS